MTVCNYESNFARRCGQIAGKNFVAWGDGAIGYIGEGGAKMAVVVDERSSRTCRLSLHPNLHAAKVFGIRKGFDKWLYDAADRYGDERFSDVVVDERDGEVYLRTDCLLDPASIKAAVEGYFAFYRDVMQPAVMEYLRECVRRGNDEETARKDEGEGEGRIPDFLRRMFD